MEEFRDSSDAMPIFMKEGIRSLITEYRLVGTPHGISVEEFEDYMVSFCEALLKNHKLVPLTEQEKADKLLNFGFAAKPHEVDGFGRVRWLESESANEEYEKKRQERAEQAMKELDNDGL